MSDTKSEDRKILIDIMSSMESLLNIMDGVSVREIEEDQELREKVEERYSKIGDNAEKLSEDFKLRYDFVQWGLLEGMNNWEDHQGVLPSYYEQFGMETKEVYESSKRRMRDELGTIRVILND